MARRPAVRPDASQAAARPSGTGAEASPAPDAPNASNASNAISEAFVGWRKPTVLWVVLILLVSAEAAHEVLGLPGPATLYESWIHCSVILAAAALCLARGARDRQSRGAWLALGSGKLLPGAIADPRALLLGGVANVKEANRLAVLLQFVFDLAGQRQRLGTGQVDAAILKLVPLDPRSVQDSHRHQSACFGAAYLAGPLEHGDGPQLGRGVAALRHLARVLGPSRQTGQNSGQQTACTGGKKARSGGRRGF